MAHTDDYLLPAGIQMPARFTKRLSYQIWFYTGAQAGLEGRAAQNEIELTKSHGAENTAAYQAGLAAGRAKRAEVEAPAHQIPVPADFSRTLQEKIWFLEGVEEGLGGKPYADPDDLPPGGSLALVRAYRAGYQAGVRHMSRNQPS